MILNGHPNFTVKILLKLCGRTNRKMVTFCFDHLGRKLVCRPARPKVEMFFLRLKNVDLFYPPTSNFVFEQQFCSPIIDFTIVHQQKMCMAIGLREQNLKELLDETKFDASERFWTFKHGEMIKENMSRLDKEGQFT